MDLADVIDQPPFPRPPAFAKATADRPVRPNGSFIGPHRKSKFLSADIASRGHDVCEIKVATATPYDFFNAFGIPYYCKIDIEGLDRLVVDAICGLKVKPKYVSFENGALRDFEALVSAGYSSFQLVEQSSISKIKLPKISLQGKSVEHIFEPGSSGPFGRDLQGEWLNFNEMRALLDEHHKSLNARSERGYDWWDLHASHS